MARLDAFMAHAEAFGSATLDDHLSHQAVVDPAVRNSLRAQCTKALKFGGKYRHLAEDGIIMPSTGGRGKQAEWEDGLVRQANNLPVVLASNAFSSLRETMSMNATHLPADVRSRVNDLVALNLTGTKGLVVAGTTEKLIHQCEMEKVTREAAEKAQQIMESALDDVRKALQFAQQQAATLAGKASPATAVGRPSPAAS